MARRSVHCPLCNQAVTVEVSQTGICVVPEHGPKRSCKGGGQVFQYREAPTRGQRQRPTELEQALRRQAASAAATRRATEAAFARD